MKLNKTMLLVVAGGIFVIVTATLAMGASRQSEEKTKLQKQLTTAQTKLQAIRLEPLSEKQTDLEKRLVEATPQLESVKDKLSEPISSTKAATAIYNAAKAYGLTVGEMTSTNSAGENIAGVDLSAISMTAQVYGDVSDVISFVRELSLLLNTGAIKLVDISIPQEVATSNITWTSSNPAVATIDSTGLATSIGTGNTTITAISGSIISNATLSVTNAPFAPVTANVSPGSQSIIIGETQRFSLIVNNSAGVVSGNTTSKLGDNTTAKIELTVYTYQGGQ